MSSATYTNRGVTIVPPGEGRSIWVAGDTYTFKAPAIRRLAPVLRVGRLGVSRAVPRREEPRTGPTGAT